MTGSTVLYDRFSPWTRGVKYYSLGNTRVKYIATHNGAVITWCLYSRVVSAYASIVAELYRRWKVSGLKDPSRRCYPGAAGESRIDEFRIFPSHSRPLAPPPSGFVYEIRRPPIRPLNISERTRSRFHVVVFVRGSPDAIYWSSFVRWPSGEERYLPVIV